MTRKSVKTILRGAGIFGACALTLSLYASAKPVPLAGDDKLPAAGERSRYMVFADSAYMMMEEERWDKAATFLESALRDSPGNPLNALLLSNLGIARTHLDDIDGALEAYNIAEAINDKESRIPENRAYTLLAAGRNDEAFEALNKSLELDSLREWPLKMRGLMLLAKGDVNGAFADLNKYADHYSSDADVWNGLASCHEYMGDTDSAVECYRKSIEITDDPLLRAELALALATAGNIDEANRNISEGLTRWPDSGELYMVRAYIEKITFQNRQSDVDRKQALRLGADPELDRRLFGPVAPGKK